jgi:hypothetical protein
MPAEGLRAIARRARTFGRLSWRERVWLVEALVIQQLLPAALRMSSIKRVERLLTAATPRRRPTDAQARARAAALAPIVAAASRRVWGPNSCLHRSLTLWWLLRWQRIDGRMRFGVRRRNGRFEAHAWVELEDVPVNDQPGVAAEYRPLSEPATRDVSVRPDHVGLYFE